MLFLEYFKLSISVCKTSSFLVISHSCFGLIAQETRFSECCRSYTALNTINELLGHKPKEELRQFPKYSANEDRDIWGCLGWDELNSSCISSRVEACLLQESLFKAKLLQFFSCMFHEKYLKSIPHLILGQALWIRFICLSQIQSKVFQVVKGKLLS